MDCASNSIRRSATSEVCVALLSVDELTVSFGGTTVLDAVSFAIGKGQRFGVVGESGAGKSVAALAIMGLLPNEAQVTGATIFDAAPLPAEEEARARLRGKRIAMVFQDCASALDPLQTVGVQVAEAMQLAGQAQGDMKAEVERLFTELGLEPGQLGRYPRELSGGERQHVLIAMALAGKPDLLICDEPASALDLVTRRRVIDAIDRACTDRGMALMYISHDLKAVASLCTKIMVLRRGKVVEIGDKLDVLGHPKHEYTKYLLAAGRHRARTLMRAPISGDLLKVRGLTKHFRQPDISLFQPRPPLVALDALSFAIRSGESLALVGPSGSGKSTLARIIAGLDRVTKGELEFDHQVYHGTDLPRMLRREISLVVQDPTTNFDPRLTIGESVAEPLRLEHGAELDELGRRIVEVVQAVGLSPDMLNRFPREFSTGQLQRFAIARALTTRPRLVVLDEPVSSLDVAVRGEVLVLLNRLRADYGLTFLIISHDLDVVRVVADRVMVMDKGRIVETGTPAQLLDTPQEPLTKQLVAAQLPDVGIVPVL
jgi:peptide/nickel transport system ATP-binding protein